MNNQLNNMSPTERWMITIAIMAATLMQVLDTTIVNVALPHIQGSLGSSPDEITWTLTSYLVASAIFMPLTGYLVNRIGRKNYLLISIAGFTLSSALCGAATSIAQMVIFRLLQGVFGAGLVPVSQAILTDIFPQNERGKAMAIWGIGVMVGPILGPSLGGYITELASWRWTFFINVPVGLMAATMVFYFINDNARKTRPLNWISVTLIAIAIGSVQYVLDRGNQKDWFDAQDIRIISILGMSSLISFILYSLRNPSTAIFNLNIFKDRNFLIASILISMMGLGLYGTMVVLPPFMEGLLNYPVLTTGLIMAPRGIASMFSMMIVGKLANRIDPRWLISAGIIISAIGIHATTYYSLSVNTWWLVWPLLLQGLGLGLIFVPLSTLAFSTLSPDLRVDAASLYSLLRTIGSSIGISITISFLSRHTQIAWHQISSTIQPFNPAFKAFMLPLHHHANNSGATAILIAEIERQSLMLSYINTFSFIMWGFLIMLPLVFLLKKRDSRTAEAT